MLSPRANADAGPPPDAEEGGDAAEIAPQPAATSAAPATTQSPIPMRPPAAAPAPAPAPPPPEITRVEAEAALTGALDALSTRSHEYAAADEKALADALKTARKRGVADDLLVEAEAALAQAKTLRSLQSNGVKLGRLSAEVEKARAALKSQRRGVAPAPPAADTDAAHMAALSAEAAVLRGRRDALRQANQRAKAQLSALQKEQHLLEEQLAQVPADAAAKKVAEAWDATGSAVGARAANHAEIVGGTRWELCLRASELWEATEEKKADSKARRLLSPPFDVGGAQWQLLVIIEGGHLSAYVDLVGAAGGSAAPAPAPAAGASTAKAAVLVGGKAVYVGDAAAALAASGGAAAKATAQPLPPGWSRAGHLTINIVNSDHTKSEVRTTEVAGGGGKAFFFARRSHAADVCGWGWKRIVSTSKLRSGGFVVDGSNPPCIVIEAELKLQPTGVDWSDEASVSAELGVAVRHLEGLDEKLRNEKKRLAALRKGALEFDARFAAARDEERRYREQAQQWKVKRLVAGQQEHEAKQARVAKQLAVGAAVKGAKAEAEEEAKSLAVVESGLGEEEMRQREKAVLTNARERLRSHAIHFAPLAEGITDAGAGATDATWKLDLQADAMRLDNMQSLHAVAAMMRELPLAVTIEAHVRLPAGVVASKDDADQLRRQQHWMEEPLFASGDAPLPPEKGPKAAEAAPAATASGGADPKLRLRWQLAGRRAAACVDALVARGVDRERMSVNAVVPTAGAERVVFVVVARGGASTQQPAAADAIKLAAAAAAPATPVGGTWETTKAEAALGVGADAAAGPAASVIGGPPAAAPAAAGVTGGLGPQREGEKQVDYEWRLWSHLRANSEISEPHALLVSAVTQGKAIEKLSEKCKATAAKMRTAHAERGRLRGEAARLAALEASGATVNAEDAKLEERLRMMIADAEAKHDGTRVRMAEAAETLKITRKAMASALEWLPPLTGPTPDTCTDRQLPSVVRAVGAQLRAWADNETAAKPAAAKPRARAKSAGPRRGGGDFKVGMREQVPAQRRPYEQFQRPHSATVIR